MVRTWLIVMLGAAATATAGAGDLTCAEDRETEALFCFAASQIKERDGIRHAPLYQGGPNGVRLTSYSIAANCSTGVLHLKDRDGVSFGGAGPGEGTEHSRRLRRLFCDATAPVKGNAVARPQAATPQVKQPPPAPLDLGSSKMKACHNEAGSRVGDERKAFMKECLTRR